MSVQSDFDKLNGRRHALIMRKLSGGGLDADGLRELDDVTKRVDAIVHALYPLPKIEEIAKRMGLPMPGDERQLEMLYACAPPDCAWCGEAHEGGPEFCEDNQSPPENAGEGSCGRPSDTHCAFDPVLGRRTGPP